MTTRFTFAPSSAHEAAPPGGQAVHIWPFFRESKASPEEQARGAEVEARQVISIIQGHRPRWKQRSGKTEASIQIAVLVRARPHLAADCA